MHTSCMDTIRKDNLMITAIILGVLLVILFLYHIVKTEGYKKEICLMGEDMERIIEENNELTRDHDVLIKKLASLEYENKPKTSTVIKKSPKSSKISKKRIIY